MEIKLKILGNINDVQTLRNLTHSSPMFREAYLFNSAEGDILTDVTIRDLTSRDIHVMIPCDVASVASKGGEKPSVNLKHALQTIQQKMKYARGKRLELEEWQCVALLTIENFVPWVTTLMTTRDGEDILIARTPRLKVNREGSCLAFVSGDWELFETYVSVSQPLHEVRFRSTGEDDGQGTDLSDALEIPYPRLAGIGETYGLQLSRNMYSIRVMESV